VTLPERGFLPLCKSEAVKMALKAYGPSAMGPLDLAMNVLREDRGITSDEFQVMMPFARGLFRECLRSCGAKDARVIETLRHQAGICRRICVRPDSLHRQ